MTDGSWWGKVTTAGWSAAGESLVPPLVGWPLELRSSNKVASTSQKLVILQRRATLTDQPAFLIHAGLAVIQDGKAHLVGKLLFWQSTNSPSFSLRSSTFSRSSSSSSFYPSSSPASSSFESPSSRSSKALGGVSVFLETSVVFLLLNKWIDFTQFLFDFQYVSRNLESLDL